MKRTEKRNFIRNILTKLFSAFTTVMLVTSGYAANFEYTLHSPDGNIKVTIRQKDDHQLEYAIQKNDEQVLEWSPLGVVTAKGGELIRNFAVISIENTSKDTVLNKLFTDDTKVKNAYNQIKIDLEENIPLKRKLNIIFRAFNNGVAFRYEIPVQNDRDQVEIIAEKTGFHFPKNLPALAQHIPHFNWSYERPFESLMLNDIYASPRLSETIVQFVYDNYFPTAWFRKKLIGLPLVVNYENFAVALTEVDLLNYAGMYLQKPDLKQPHFVSRLSPLPNENGIAVKSKLPLETPWRLIMIGDTTGELTTSNLIQCLATPSKIDDLSWIKPGVAAWDFMADREVSGVEFEGGMNMQTMKYYIDFAAEYNLEYFIIDWGWTETDAEWYKETPSVDLTKAKENLHVKALVDYAAEKNVGLFVWARWDNVRDQMEEAFSTFKNWGVKGVKIDFMESDDQNMVNWYEKCLATAARYQLLINFHGAYKPTGLMYTYPNYITEEAAQGLEWVNMCDYIDPQHNVSLAFSRNIIGPMDYTPGGFNNVLPENFQLADFSVQGTRAHQLALMVIFNSPLLALADAPHVYRANEESAFIKELVTTWDETVVLHEKFNQYMIQARKHRDIWFLGGITNWNSLETELSFDFLDNNKSYEFTLYKDASNASEKPKNVEIIKTQVQKGEVISIKMVSGGGFAARIKPVQ